MHKIRIPEIPEKYDFNRTKTDKIAIILYNNNNTSNDVIDELLDKINNNNIDFYLTEHSSYKSFSKYWAIKIKNPVGFIPGLELGIKYACSYSHSQSMCYKKYILIDHNHISEINVDNIKKMIRVNSTLNGIFSKYCVCFNAEWLDTIRYFNHYNSSDKSFDTFLKPYCNYEMINNTIEKIKEKKNVDVKNIQAKFPTNQKSNKVAMVIVNYNMEERCSQICKNIKEKVKNPVDFYVVDNGSDLVNSSPHTTIWLRKNVQTSNGWNMGIAYSNAVRHTNKSAYFGYWIWITSSLFDTTQNDILSPMVQYLEQHPKTQTICPYISNRTNSWPHLFKKGVVPREVIFVDNLATLYRTEWFDSIRYFDPNEIRGFGVDMENGFLVRYCGYNSVVDDRVGIQKHSGIAYSMKRMNANSSSREQLALKEMKTILTARYGTDYPKLNRGTISLKKGIFTNRRGTWTYII